MEKGNKMKKKRTIPIGHEYFSSDIFPSFSDRNAMLLSSCTIYNRVNVGSRLNVKNAGARIERVPISKQQASERASYIVNIISYLAIHVNYARHIADTYSIFRSGITYSTALLYRAYGRNY